MHTQIHTHTRTHTQIHTDTQKHTKIPPKTWNDSWSLQKKHLYKTRRSLRAGSRKKSSAKLKYEEMSASMYLLTATIVRSSKAFSYAKVIWLQMEWIHNAIRLFASIIFGGSGILFLYCFKGWTVTKSESFQMFFFKLHNSINRLTIPLEPISSTTTIFDC